MTRTLPRPEAPAGLVAPSFPRRLKTLIRRALLGDYRFPYRRAAIRQRVRESLRGRDAPRYDLVLVVPRGWGWIIEAICRELADRFPGTWHLHHGAEEIPRARRYFFGHQALFPTALLQSPWVRRGRTQVLYTHPSDYLGISDAEYAYALGLADRVLFMCSVFREALVGAGLDRRRAALVYGGADPALFRPHRRTGDGAVGLSMAYYARKAPDRVLELVQRMPHRRFLLLGRGWDGYERFGELIGLPNLEYVEAPYRDYPAHYARMDVFVSPAILEGGPIPLIEAMMSNVVPVASRTGFAPDLIRDGEDGFLFDVHATAGEIAALVDRAFGLEAEVWRSARQLSWDDFARRIFPDLPPRGEGDAGEDGSRAGRPEAMHASSPA